ncbi:hypothetical protein KEM55_005625 [Ascosphaera atra]|nr:hypothetical protein KEM55_005625 [Ascosphaera atra]
MHRDNTGTQQSVRRSDAPPLTATRSGLQLADVLARTSGPANLMPPSTSPLQNQRVINYTGTVAPSVVPELHDFQALPPGAEAQLLPEPEPPRKKARLDGAKAEGGSSPGHCQTPAAHDPPSQTDIDDKWTGTIDQQQQHHRQLSQQSQPYPFTTFPSASDTRPPATRSYSSTSTSLFPEHDHPTNTPHIYAPIGYDGSCMSSSPEHYQRHSLRDTKARRLSYEKDAAAAVPPSSTHASAEKRSLRSHGGASAGKSELAAYFPNYEELVSLGHENKEETLGLDTEISIVDDLTEPLNLDEHVAPEKPEFLNPLQNLDQVEVVEIPSSNAQVENIEDPLPDELYFKAHRRLERQEKQLRNIERDRAQHEKIQLDRLLDELEGHEWLRTMGISGITESEKRLYQPKRAYLVREVSALINKFKMWKEEEKRRRLEKEQALLDDAEEKEEILESDDTAGKELSEGEKEDANEEELHYTGESDVDAMAARQLHQETLSASSTPHNLKRPKLSIRALEAKTRRIRISPSSTPVPADSKPASRHAGRHAPTEADSSNSQQQQQQQHLPAPKTPSPVDDRPFTSFYTQPHIRDIALGKTKASRRSRGRLAFGQPVPDLPEQEFKLPSDILTEEAVHAAQRKFRRLRRAHKS